MKLGLIVLATRLPAIACFAAAGAMAFYGQDGWGWFLFVGSLSLTGVSISESKSEVESV